MSGLRIGPAYPPGAGQSGDILLFDATWQDEGRERAGGFVMKRQPASDRIFLDADVLDECRVLQGLAGTGVPVPAVIGGEADAAVLGTPFFVMARVDGDVPAGRPSMHVAGWLPTLTETGRGRVWESGLDTLAAVHRVDWRRTHPFLPGAGEALAAGGDPLAAYVRRLGRWYRWAAAGRDFPVTDAAWAHLAGRRERAGAAESVLVWGDARPGNMIFGGDLSVAAALDWEVAMIGPPEIDLAHWLVFDEFVAADVTRLPGFPGREAVLDRYTRNTGRTPRDLEYFEVLQAFFLATTIIRQADLGVAAGRFAQGTTMGYGNTVTRMLARRLGLPEPALSPDWTRHRRPRQNPVEHG
ncbi:phosphotransferase family protein [Streptomyces sp. NPDC001255]|uniref:phosphotransferase family protein n=1 Tax=Streptomyces sp. NPDC001255 TaxID=3364550 RepID=UPI003676981E